MKITFDDYLLNMPIAGALITQKEDARIYRANTLFFDMLGYDEKALEVKSGNRLSTLLPVEEYLQIRNFMQSDERRLSLELSFKAYQKQVWVNAILEKSEDPSCPCIVMYVFEVNEYKKNKYDLDNLRDMFHQVLDYEGLGVILFDPVTCLIQYCYTVSFVLQGHCVGKSFPEVFLKSGRIQPDYIDVLEKTVNLIRKAEPESHKVCELLVLNVHNEYIWIRMIFSKHSYQGKEFILLMLSDVNAQKYAALRYSELSMFYQSILTSHEAYGHADITANKVLQAGGLIEAYNELKNDMTYDEILKKSAGKMIHPDDCARFLEIMDSQNLIESYQNGIRKLDCDFRRIISQNKMTWLSNTVHLFLNPIDQHLMASLYYTNIDEEKRQKLQYSSNEEYDKLTQLYNRKTLEQKIGKHLLQMKCSEISAFILCNINEFRRINAVHGFLTGDEVLVRLSNILSTVFRRSDILGRFENDKFILLLKDVEGDWLKKRVQQLFSSIEEEIHIPFSVSLGIVYVSMGDSFINSYKQASIALSGLEINNKNTYALFNEQMIDSINERTKGYQILDSSKILDEDYSAQNGVTYDLDEFNRLVGGQGDITYLINPDNFLLITANQAFYERLGVSETDCYGRCCYELLHKRSTPCPFCQKSNWSKDRYYMYRNYNPVFHQEFLIKNKLVVWKGENALLAIAVDLSNDKSNHNILENDISEENYILSGIRNMQRDATLDNVMMHALESIGQFFRADAVRFWTNDHNCVDSITCKWKFHVMQNVEHVEDYDDIENEIIKDWLHNRKWIHSIRFDNQDSTMFESYKMYQLMRHKNIMNEHWIVVKDGDKELGILEIDNIRSNFQNTTFMKNFTPFMINEWKKCSMVDNILYNINHDALTGVYNRTTYDNDLRLFESDKIESLGVVVLDINGLREINKLKGSEIGDLYLRYLAQQISEIFIGARYYRLGGDEYQIIWTNIDVTTLENKIRILRERVHAYNEFTIAVGFAWDSVEKDMNSLINFATQSKKVDKQNQSARVQEIKESDHYKLQSELLASIEKGDYLVYLQPKVNARDGNVVGAEALIRFYDKAIGIIPPAEYIPQFEKNGLIRFIDLFVFEEVCKTIQKWQKTKKKCPVISLNFSRVTMMEQNLIEIMDTMIEKYDTPKKYIEIEITESFADVGKALLYQNAKRIHKAGYAVALDDFGTNFTNLSILSDIHVDVLKIDKSLIHSMTSQKKNITVLKHIIDMCTELGIKVIAEGVENMEQRNQLMNLGCFLIQGYLFSRPVDIISFEKAFLPRVKEVQAK